MAGPYRSVAAGEGGAALMSAEPVPAERAPAAVITRGWRPVGWWAGRGIDSRRGAGWCAPLGVAWGAAWGAAWPR